MRGAKTLSAVLAVIAVLALMGCGPTRATPKGSPPPPVKKIKCTATTHGGSSATLVITLRGSDLHYSTLAVQIVSARRLAVGDILVAFPGSLPPPAATNGWLSVSVQDGQAVFPLNPRSQQWEPPSESLLELQATGDDGSGHMVSARCRIKVALAKLLTRTIDCLRKSGEKLYDLALTFYGTDDHWRYKVNEGGVTGGYASQNGTRTYTSPSVPKSVTITQIRSVRDASGRLRVQTKPVRIGEQSDEFGSGEHFRLKITGPSGYTCGSTLIRLRA